MHGYKMAKLYILKEYKGKQLEIVGRLQTKLHSLLSNYNPNIHWAKSYATLSGKKIRGTIGVGKQPQTIEVKLQVPFFSKDKIRKILDKSIEEIVK